MRKFLILMMMVFMTLGPVASLSAQVNSLESVNSLERVSNLDTVTSMSAQTEMHKTDENTQQHAQTQTEAELKHNCCEDNEVSKCSCSYQNQCDIQKLTFFALLKLPSSLPSSIKPDIAIPVSLSFIDKSMSNSIYRPPIT